MSKFRLRLPLASKEIINDVLVASVCWYSVLVFSNITADDVRSPAYSALLATVAVAATIWGSHRKCLYDSPPTLARTGEISAVFTSVFTAVAAVVIYAAFGDIHIGAWEIVLGSLFAFTLRTIANGIADALIYEINSTRDTVNVVVVGAGLEAKELVQLIRDHPETRLRFCGVIGNLSVAERSGLADCWIGPTGRLIDIMRDRQIQSAIVTTTGFRGERFKAIARDLFAAGFDVHLTTGISRMWEGRFDVKSLVHEPFVTVRRNNRTSWETGAKRAMDIVGSMTAIVVFSPVMLLTALAVYSGDRNRVFYTSTRIGNEGEEFQMYKFRSMTPNADKLKDQIAKENERTGPLFKMSHDPRITTVGRIIRETSLDELPQLFNVLKGDMSLVGPRPALPEENSDFDDEHQTRTSVRPGITGLWQVEARSNASFNAYRRLDLHYVENWNLLLDLRILLATAEMIAIAMVLLPFKPLLARRSKSIDGINGKSATSAIDPPTMVLGNEDAEVIDLTNPAGTRSETSKTSIES